MTEILPINKIMRRNSSISDVRYSQYLDDVKEHGDSGKFISEEGFQCELTRNPILGIWIGSINTDTDTLSTDQIEIKFDRKLYIYKERERVKVLFDCGSVDDFIPADAKLNYLSVPSSKTYRDYDYAKGKIKELSKLLSKLKIPIK